jgi:vacuolar protein sorting-associated protein IST1
LTQVRDQLVAKYGREFGEMAINNRLGTVNVRVVQKLKVQTPDPVLVTSYLKEIAKTFGVPFDENSLINTRALEDQEVSDESVDFSSSASVFK